MTQDIKISCKLCLSLFPKILNFCISLFNYIPNNHISCNVRRHIFLNNCSVLFLDWRLGIHELRSIRQHKLPWNGEKYWKIWNNEFVFGFDPFQMCWQNPNVRAWWETKNQVSLALSLSKKLPKRYHARLKSSVRFS